MKRQVTIYFDTSFYVHLCKAAESVAERVVQELNELNVRHVISDVIIRELLTSRDRTDLDKALVRRVHKFSLAPYRTRGDLTWEVLLLAGQERLEVANLLRGLHDDMSKATSLSIVARKELNADQQVELSVANKPLLQQYGFPEDLEQNLPQVISAAKSMLEGLGVSGINWPENPTPDDLLELSEQLKNLLGSALVAQLEEEGRIQDSLTRMEDRPFHVAVGSATAKAKKRLSNTLRDAEHIMLFVNNNSEIDLLQVDRVQEEIIRRDKPRHRLSELGLADRCFSADSITDVVETAREMIRDLRISAGS